MYGINQINLLIVSKFNIIFLEVFKIGHLVEKNNLF